MQCYWEQVGILGPTYRLLGRGWSNHDIAAYLGRTDETIDDCVTWVLNFLNIGSRAELALRADPGRAINPMTQSRKELSHDNHTF